MIDPRKDFILRTIEEIGVALAALRNRILGRKADPAAVADELRRLTQAGGLDLELAKVLAPDSLPMIIAPAGEVEPGRCWVLAESLFLDGLDSELDGRPAEALESYARAGALFRLVAPLGAYLTGFPEALERIDEIDERVAGLQRPD